jgi:hypothetical protein
MTEELYEKMQAYYDDCYEEYLILNYISSHELIESEFVGGVV